MGRNFMQYDNTSMQYTVVFTAVKIDNFQLRNFDIFLAFGSKHRLWLQNIDCGYMIVEAVLTSTHNLCFKAKIRK